MAVTEQTPLNQYTANGATTVFAFSFLLLQASDLKVQVTDTSGATSTKTLGVDFTVAGLGVSAGGTVTFLTAPSNSSKVVIFRDSDIARSTDYQDNGDLLADTINQDLDRLWLVMQEIFNGGKGAPTALRVPNGETVASLPSAADRANRLVGFDSNGAPVAVLPTAGDATSLALDIASSNSAAKGAGQMGFAYALAYGAGTIGKWLKDLALAAGSTLIGWAQAGTGAVTRTVSDRLRETVSVKDFGATGDGVTDDTAAIAAAIAALPANGGTVYFPPGTYITDPITMPTTAGGAVHAVHLVGFNARSCVLQARQTNKPLIQGQAIVTTTYATAPNRIKKLAFKPHASGSTGAAVDMRRMSYTEVRDVEFVDNGTGRFTYGLLLDTESGAGHCYENAIDGVRVNNQTWGPVTLIRGVGTPNLHRVRNVSCVGSMPMDGIVVDTTAVMWDIDRMHWEGPLGTAIKSGNYTTVRNSYFESTTAAVDATGRTSMNVQFERCYFNSAPLLGGAATNYGFIGCFDSAGSIKSNQWQGGGDFGNTNFLFPTAGGLSLDGANRHMRGATLTLASGATAQFTQGTTQGNQLAFIVNDNAQSAIYQARGGANATVEVSDPQTVYSTVAGTASSTNIYWSGTRYEIQNNTGSTRTYTILYVTA